MAYFENDDGSSLFCSLSHEQHNVFRDEKKKTRERRHSLNGMSQEASKLKKVLVLYTGGTIGMVPNLNGEKNALVSKLKTIPIFYDEAYAEEHFSENEKADHLIIQHSCKSQRVVYIVEEFDPLLDSSNMDIKDWAAIATRIHERYDLYDGFVVLHGTDTMAYTASALSFMCENLGKPIVCTGSQIPIFEARSDGRDNFISSLIVAGNYSIPEVMICFDRKVFRGNRCIKQDATRFSAFSSPNMLPLVTLAIDIHVDWSSIFRNQEVEKFKVHTSLCPNVALLRLFPGITTQTVLAFCRPPMQGIVVQTYGAGNAPDNRPDLLQAFREACNWGVIIVNITQCVRGSVSTSYATGKALYDAGVIPGNDMTPEAALAKLTYVLGKDEWNLAKKRKMMGRNLRGEMTADVHAEISILDFELIESVAKTLCLSSREEIVKLRDALYPNLMCAAAKTGDIPALEKLRQTGGNLSVGNQDGRTPLHVSCRCCHHQTIQYLLHHGASVHCRDYQGDTPLIDSLSMKDQIAVKMLVQAGATIPWAPMKTALELCSAVMQNDLDCIKCWKCAGVDFNVCDHNNRTALHVASYHNAVAIVKYLLKNGGDFEKEDIFGHTPHSHAEELGHTEIIQIYHDHLEHDT